jgi:RNA polymerase sigma factor (sigma-70 family)
MRGEHYGRLGIATISSVVRHIWYRRNIEPEPCELFDFYCPTQTDPDLDVRRDLAHRLVAITPLNKREEQIVILCVLGNSTLQEVAEEMEISRERVRQILNGAMRKFREYHFILTGERKRKSI